MAVIEYARNILHLEGANSTEMDPDTPHPVIDLMEEQNISPIWEGPCDLGRGNVI